MSASFLALVVVYGSEPATTPTLRSLARCSLERCGLRTIVWDNSPEPALAGGSAPGLQVDYVSTPENLGLSTIYNRVSTTHLRAHEHLLLLDQDTELAVDYLTRAALAIEHHPGIDLFLPRVRANGRWASPVSYLCGWGRQWRKPIIGLVSSKRICAINSGMIISADYLRPSPRYDERLRFYGTDTQFMLDYSDRRSQLCVLDATLLHDLSFFSVDSRSQAKKFAAMKAAYDLIYEKRPWFQQAAVRLVMLAVSIRYAIRHRESTFLRGRTI